MPRWGLFCVVLLSLWSGGRALAEFEATEFAREYEGFRDDPAYETKTPAADNIRFIFVSGLKGENDPTYFSAAANELRTLTRTHGEKDPQKMRVYVVKPNSQFSIEEGDAYMQKKIREIVAASPPGTRFRLVGHSLGGFRLWNYLNEHPEFAAKVEAAVYIQTPFGGSPLAQYIVERRKISDVIPLQKNPFQVSALWTLAQVFRWYEPSLRILVPEAAQGHMEYLRQKVGEVDQRELLDKSVMFSTYREPYSGWRVAIPGPATILNTCGKALAKLKPGRNDGLVHVADQTVAGAQSRTVQYPGLNHRAMTSFYTEAIPFARALWSLPATH